jgi:hypothetical protein
MSEPVTRSQIWGAPVLLGLASAIGLLSALLADGVWDAVSWIALSAPALVCGYHLWFNRRNGAKSE